MPTAQRRPITVSIVSHGQQAMVLPLLQQLEQHSLAWVEQIVLTVNIPEPGLVAERSWQLPIVTSNNARPRGFGANHNAALIGCRTPWLLVLNPDIRLDLDVLGPLLAQATDSCGLLAPRIVEPGRADPEPHRALLTPWEIYSRRRSGYRTPARPAWIPGMFMLLRNTAFQEIGGFDPRFFMYGEDFDICARLQLAGWTLGMSETLCARHEAQRASRRSWRHLRWHFASLLKVWTSSAFWRYRALHTAPD